MRKVRYRRAEVEKLREERLGPVRDPLTGEIVATAFELFESGGSRADVVRKLRLHPDDVDALDLRWRGMRETAISLNVAELEEVRRALGRAPIHNARDLVGAIEKWAHEARRSGVNDDAPAPPPEAENTAATLTSSRHNDFDFDYLRAGAERMRPFAGGLLTAIELYLAGKADRTMLDGYMKTLPKYLESIEPEEAKERAKASLPDEARSGSTQEGSREPPMD